MMRATVAGTVAAPDVIRRGGIGETTTVGDGIAGETVAHETAVGGTTALEIVVGGTVARATIDTETSTGETVGVVIDGAMLASVILLSGESATRVDFKIGIVGGNCPIYGTHVGPLT